MDDMHMEVLGGGEGFFFAYGGYAYGGGAYGIDGARLGEILRA
jgi:hypothetical protein